jgi:hypothetical protein
MCVFVLLEHGLHEYYRFARVIIIGTQMTRIGQIKTDIYLLLSLPDRKAGVASVLSVFNYIRVHPILHSIKHKCIAPAHVRNILEQMLIINTLTYFIKRFL